MVQEYTPGGVSSLAKFVGVSIDVPASPHLLTLVLHHIIAVWPVLVQETNGVYDRLSGALKSVARALPIETAPIIVRGVSRGKSASMAPPRSRRLRSTGSVSSSASPLASSWRPS